MGLTEHSAQHTPSDRSHVGRAYTHQVFPHSVFSPFSSSALPCLSFLCLPQTERFQGNSRATRSELGPSVPSCCGSLCEAWPVTGGRILSHDVQPIPTLARHPTSVPSRPWGPSSVHWARLKCSLYFLWKEVGRKDLKSGLGTLTSCELCAADWEW